ncbi:hypothetical protein [Puniceibacterium sp. IMCC21224]|uniref:hypothetical protein n=1 Tax=Puniceibacterium sp. IMCC21224 TaxID=1618204 RepID=UPI00064D72F4|nr:hypothetical protein [Puniceibacterium sp. IMCC21224]KMK68270.1 hypothetical protein IMCC21224_113151 [Puniceibacterium sp. IMCC21224]
MPIAHITVAPELVAQVTAQAGDITETVTAILKQALDARVELIQVVLSAALATPQGCDVLCEVQHRASIARNGYIRQAAAQQLHDALQQATGGTVRVRLIALAPEDIAAVDSPEVLK